jgi:hypothetical protein
MAAININDLGLVAGSASLPDNNSRHAMLWLMAFASISARSADRTCNAMAGQEHQRAWSQVSHRTRRRSRGGAWSCRSFFDASRALRRRASARIGKKARFALPTSAATTAATGANNNRQVVGWARTRSRMTVT